MPLNSLSAYPHGFNNGVSIRGVPVLNAHAGNVWWVDSAIGNDSTGNDGTLTRPFATIDYAVGRCLANNGDVILVAPGHTEDMDAAAALDLDVAGITVRGMGMGRDRPTITYTATAGDIDVDAANITLENFIIDVTGIDVVVAGLDVNAADFTLLGCEIIQADSAGQATRFIVTDGEAHRMKVLGCTVRSTTAGAASFVNIVGTPDGIEIAHNHIYGDFSVAAIENATSNVATNLNIHHNYIQNDNNGNWAIELVSASTGVISDNHVVTDAIATAVDWGSCSAFGNLYFDDGTTDSAGTPIPTAATTGGYTLDEIGDALIGADGIATMPSAAVPANAVNAFELLREIWAVLNGTAAGENGVQAWPTAAAYASNVSIAEVLAYIQDGTRRGTGTTLAANESLADVLYAANGIVTFPAAASPTDGVSIAEVLRSSWARNIAGINPLGTVIFVATSGGSDSNAGTSPNAAKATIASAITAAGAGGTIVLGPGTHNVDVSVAALTPLANQQFVSAIPALGGAPRAVIANDADDGANVVLIDVDGTVWRDIEFRNVTAATTCVTLMSVAQTTAVRGLHVENCWFNQNGLDGVMISVALNDATNAVTGAVFKNNRFTGATGTTSSVKYIQIGVGGVPAGLFEYNVFECQSADNDARAFDFLDPGTSAKSYGVTIRYNDFIGPSDGGLDAVPLQFAAAMTENEIIGMIRTNYFSACATPPIPIDLVNNSVVFNYGNDNATGGTLVDPGT